MKRIEEETRAANKELALAIADGVLARLREVLVSLQKRRKRVQELLDGLRKRRGAANASEGGTSAMSNAVEQGSKKAKPAPSGAGSKLEADTGPTHGGSGKGGGKNSDQPPRNAHLAGKKHPETGVPFDKDGYPDFKAVGAVRKEVKIEPTGSRYRDFKAANEKAGLTKTPEGYTWHHHQDGTTMQLVPRDIHAKTGHTGGFSITGGR